MDEAEAMADFEAAEKLDPSNSDVFHHRGQLNLLLDRTKEACRDFEKSVALEPDFALAQMQNAYTQYRYEYAYTQYRYESIPSVHSSHMLVGLELELEGLMPLGGLHDGNIDRRFHRYPELLCS